MAFLNSVLEYVDAWSPFFKVTDSKAARITYTIGLQTGCTRKYSTRLCIGCQTDQVHHMLPQSLEYTASYFVYLLTYPCDIFRRVHKKGFYDKSICFTGVLSKPSRMAVGWNIAKLAMSLPCINCVNYWGYSHSRVHTTMRKQRCSHSLI